MANMVQVLIGVMKMLSQRVLVMQLAAHLVEFQWLVGKVCILDKLSQVHCIGIAMALHQDCIGIAWALHQHCIGIASALHRYCINFPSALHLYYNGIASALQQHCINIALALHQDCDDQYD